MRKFMKRAAVLLLAFLFLAIVVLMSQTNPDGLSKNQVVGIVAQLNEAAAIGVPHDYLLDEETRQANAPLLTKVESGALLTTEESVIYRKFYQAILFNSQVFLGRFDAELSVIPDHALTTPNNIGTQGIAGHHDHHDLSARKNFAQVLESLDRLRKATTFIGRIRYSNTTQKDLVDLISHLGVAPHTVSVPYASPDMPWPDEELGRSFEAMTMAFKTAQQHQVNSQDYWLAVDEALKNYANLILAVQQRVQASTTNWERRIAGNFNSKQTLAPPVDLTRVLRRR